MSTQSQNAASPLSEERVREYEQMLSAVTPGPWTAGRPDMATIVDGVDSKWIYDARNQYLAVASGRIDGDWDEVMANARFIAAAPTIVAELLADRTALTARLEAVARLTDEEETVIASLRWRVENYRRHMTESGAAGGDMRVSGDHLECLIEAIDRLVPAPNHPSPART